jgi:sugar/nucleoside kinase (ribokinase family)
MTSTELRQKIATQLETATPNTADLTAFVGLDGFVDLILHLVDKRESAERFTRVPTIAKYAERLAAAAGRSTNIELVTTLTKLGGNGPIMANALAAFGTRVTYLGNLGFPAVHPIFEEFTRRAEVHSIAQPAFTDALEFEDGKIMMGKLDSLGDVSWDNIVKHYGRERFAAKFSTASLVGFVNWTMIPHMSDIWATVQRELCPHLTGPRRKLFVDLADPEKRTTDDLRRALELVSGFERWFDVILGLNEKEAGEVGRVFGLNTTDNSADGLCRLALAINERVPVNTIVVHPVAFALTVSKGKTALVEGPFIAKPKITTGAGDHFNSGFCLGRLLGFDNEASLLCGVTTSGHYVRTAKSPSVADLVAFMRNWPGHEK